MSNFDDATWVEVKEDITPTPAFFAEFGKKGLTGPTCCMELVDNSLDANASRVEIDWYPNRFEIRDNGDGVESLALLYRLGGRHEHGPSCAGRYGVGAKDAIACLGNISDSVTLRNGNIQVARFNYQRASMDFNYKVCPGSPGRVDELDLLNGRGTRITITDHVRSPSKVESVAKRLGYYYLPSLESGAEISLDFRGKQKMVEPYQRPPLTDVQTHRHDFGGGRVASVEVGLVKRGHSNPYSGFNIAHHKRVVEQTLEPCNGFSHAHVFGWCKLISGDWALSHHKDALVDDKLREELYGWLKNMSRAVLEKGDLRTDRVAVDFVRTQIQQDLVGLLGVPDLQKERRNQTRYQDGTVATVDSGKERLEAEKVSGPGKCKDRGGANKKKTIGAVDVDYAPMGEDTPIVNMDWSGKRLRVTVNTDHAFCRDARSALPWALRAVVISSVCHGVTTMDPRKRQQKLPGLDLDEGYGDLVTRVLSRGIPRDDLEEQMSTLSNYLKQKRAA